MYKYEFLNISTVNRTSSNVASIHCRCSSKDMRVSMFRWSLRVISKILEKRHLGLYYIKKALDYEKSLYRFEYKHNANSLVFTNSLMRSWINMEIYLFTCYNHTAFFLSLIKS